MKIQPKHLAIGSLWALALLALATVAWLRFFPSPLSSGIADTIGPGDYQLETTTGEPFNYASLKGAPSAVFFGFTHCPDVCPTTLGEVTEWQEQLGADNELRVFFVTVDPERDTLEQLGEYVSWVPSVIGVSGTREEIDKAIKGFRIYAKKVPLTDGDYTMDHSANVLLFDKNGRFFEPVGYQEDLDRAVNKIKRMQGI